MTYDYSHEAEMFEKAVFLAEDDVRELSWVVDVLESDYILDYDELRDLAGVIRSKLPKPEPAMPTRPGAMVYDEFQSVYVTFAGKWYLMGKGADVGMLLEVPWESIRRPIVQFDGYEVVE